jgi:excisionase family DNA binding protein
MPDDQHRPAEDAPVSTSDTWTVRVTALVLRVSTAWIYKLVDADEIPHRRSGSSIFFDRRELSAWLRNRRGSAS